MGKEGDKTNYSSEFIKWFSELNKNSGNVAGGKGANLGEIYNLKIPVPPGFVVTAQAYDYFIEKSGIREKMSALLEDIDYEKTEKLDETTKKIRELISNSKMPKDLEDEIIESYETLSTERAEGEADEIIGQTSEQAYVAVRSSATAEDLPDASFAGQQETFLNVRGKEELIEKIKKCFASLFTSRATYYRKKKGFKDINIKLAVIVQKMINATKSGVVFSKEPTGKNQNIIIESVYGLGEGIVSGMITPDMYVLSGNEDELKIIEKKVSDKKIAVAWNADKKIEVKLPEDKSKSQVLNNYEIEKLAKTALKLEEHYKKPQDIEFAIDSDGIYIVQTRAITTISKTQKVREIYGEVILEGIPASPGISFGNIKIIKSMQDLNKISKGDVLVTKMTNPDMVVAMQRAEAIITDEGGLTSHAAIVSREMGIPAVVGTDKATSMLKERETVTVDGFTGKIYKGKVSEAVQKEVQQVTSKTKTKIKVTIDLPSFAERAAKTNLKEVGLLRIEGIIAESGKHPNYFVQDKKIKDYEEIIFKGVKKISEYFDKLWVRTSDVRSDEFSNLQGSPKQTETNPMLGFHGIRFGIKNPEILKAELNALRRVARTGKEIGLLLPQVISVDEVKKVKHLAKEINFSDAEIGVMIETPASVQIIRELCEIGIDFVSFGTNDLTQYTLAIDRGNEKVQYIYDEMNPAVLHQLEYVIRIAKKNNVQTSICGQAGSKKEMVKFLVEKGIDSISVNPDAAKEISEYIHDLEKKASPKKELIEDFPIRIPEENLVPLEELQEDEETETEEMQKK